MKLKHGDNFAKKTGSIWRLLFVFALFPWLRQYRVLNDEDELMLESEMDESTSNDLGASVLLREKVAALNAKIKRLTFMNKNLSRRNV